MLNLRISELPGSSYDWPAVKPKSVDQLQQIGIFILVLFGVHLINFVSGMWLNRFGIIPRTFRGLQGILFSPLLHANWSHLAANAAPLAVMLCLVAFGSRQPMWPITISIWVISGTAIWLVGRPGSVQIGASALIYGLAAFLVTEAWVKRDLKSALVALLVIVLYGGIVWGLLPTRQGVSWEGHLCGVAAGILVAKIGWVA